MKEELKDKKIHSIQWQDRKANSQLKDEDVKEVTGGARSSATANNEEVIEKIQILGSQKGEHRS